jgi:diacylglycerol kinase (ATP)
MRAESIPLTTPRTLPAPLRCGVRWTAVVNPTAGRGRTRSLLPKLERAFHERGVQMHVASDAAEGQRVAREAFGRGEGVVACGGDGTVSGLAACAADAGAPLAIVPTGAGNDFARHLGLDHKHALDAVRLLDAERTARVDLGRACADDGSEYVFTTVANTGFDAHANRWANGVRWATGTPLYLLAVARTLAVYRPRPFQVRVDDEKWEGDAWLIAVGNTRWYAGGMMIAPSAEIDDGQLDVCVIEGAPMRRFVVNFPKVFKGTHVELPDVTVLRGRNVEIGTPDDDRPMDVWASGEHVGPLPARLESMPAALDVIVP